ncbi:hypothetical protein ALP29_201688 [Pseudomonas syringae pv. avii]|uniref:Uncharacterized protein n=1 Tax=Pseudomonas syringae pv. avii TaxID=663959 RepID=A0A3M5V356_PSESX|nr:hypothetical protein ALP29_201688 [Pseudomonas syringae pv. avii]
MDHLRAVAQQALRNLAAQGLVEQPDHGVFDHQPQPADQHHHGDPGRQRFLAVDQNETGDTGHETERRNEPRVALHQVEHGCHKAVQITHFSCSLGLKHTKNAQLNKRCARHAPRVRFGVRILCFAPCPPAPHGQQHDQAQHATRQPVQSVIAEQRFFDAHIAWLCE